MMHTNIGSPLTPCTVHIIYIIHAAARVCHRKSFRALSTPPSSAFLSFLPLSPFYPAFQKLQKSNGLGQGRRMIKPHREPLGRHGNRILLSGPRRRLTCRIITRRYIRSRKEKAWPSLGVVSEEGRMKKLVTIWSEISQAEFRLGKTSMILSCAKKVLVRKSIVTHLPPIPKYLG